MKNCWFILSLVCLSACFANEDQELRGPTYVDSAGVILSSRESLQNLERAQLVVVVDRIHPELPRAPVDTCGSPALGFTADVVMTDGHDFVFSGHGESPCNAGGVRSNVIGLALDERSTRTGSIPKERVSGIRLRSTVPVTVRKIEWQTWEQGL